MEVPWCETAVKVKRSAQRVTKDSRSKKMTLTFTVDSTQSERADPSVTFIIWRFEVVLLLNPSPDFIHLSFQSYPSRSVTSVMQIPLSQISHFESTQFEMFYNLFNSMNLIDSMESWLLTFVVWEAASSSIAKKESASVQIIIASLTQPAIVNHDLVKVKQIQTTTFNHRNSI